MSWIAVDWGTSNLRAWLMDADGEVRDFRQSGAGMASLEREEFEAALLDLVEDGLAADGPTTILACGMVGAAQGWAEAPYVETPCLPPGVQLAVRPAVRDPRLDVYILPGVKQLEPPDVMRGEETQICGFLAGREGFTGTLCLPGTHTKWVAVDAGRIDRFQTCMTGELFALLSERSVLRHSISAEQMDNAAFLDAVDVTIGDPACMGGELFRIRAGGLLRPRPGDAVRARSRLSGLLIGGDLASAQSYWDGPPVVVVGQHRLAEHYRQAIDHLGGKSEVVDAAKLSLEGLRAAHRELGG